MGIYWYIITQPKQWVFFILLSIEYVFQSRSLLLAHFRKDQNLYVVLLLFLMAMHGALVGVAWGNNIPKVITDTVPVAFAGLNVLLLTKVDAFDGFKFDRLCKINQAYAITMVAVGMLAVAAGRPSIVNLGGAVPTSVCLSIIFVSLMASRPPSWRELVILTSILVLIAPNGTRTMVAVSTVAFGAVVVRKVIISGTRLYFTLVIMVIAAGTVPMVMPEDSPLMRRLEALQSVDLTERTGSIGERQAEWEAINEELHRRGALAELFGRGHGTIYKVVFSDGRIPENYSHAHYGWALFKLRYGQVGYLYLILFAAFLLSNVIRNFRSQQGENRVAFLLGVWGLVYMFTYMFYNLFVSGVQFSHNARARDSQPAERKAPRMSHNRVPRFSAASRLAQRRQFSRTRSG